MIRYTLSPTPDQVDAAARMVDESGQLKNPLKWKRFRKSRIIAIALNPQGEVVGVGTVKKGKGPVAESGYLVVSRDYQRQGIAFRLLELRIEESKRIGIKLLWTQIKPHNVAPIALVLRLNFQPWGRFAKGDGSGSATLFYYLPLSREVDCDAVMSDVTRERVRLDA